MVITPNAFFTKKVNEVMEGTNRLLDGLKSISKEIGIIAHTIRLPRMHSDPKIINYGIWPCNTTCINGNHFEGRSGASNYLWHEAIMATLGETFERYTPVFYDITAGIESSYERLSQCAIHPNEFALFHEQQYSFFNTKKYSMVKFQPDTVVRWYACTDLCSGGEVLCPGQFIYLPYSHDKKFITAGNSTGLAAHTNYYKAILTALYECIERDSFVITWANNIVPQKFIISPEIRDYLNQYFPKYYDWHFFDITYDLGIPSVFCICFGKAEYGEFIAVASATRGTYAEAIKKVIQEIGQTIPYFRWLLEKRKDWAPSDDFNAILNFADHSIFYLKRKDLWHIFEKWKYAEERKLLNFLDVRRRSDIEEIRYIVKVLSNAGCNVLFKDISTPDIRDIGYYSIRIVIPQLIQLSGGYPFYFLGGSRIYTVPEKLGLGRKDFSELNKYPHPFP